MPLKEKLDPDAQLRGAAFMLPVREAEMSRMLESFWDAEGDTPEQYQRAQPLMAAFQEYKESLLDIGMRGWAVPKWSLWEHAIEVETWMFAAIHTPIKKMKLEIVKWK